MTCIKNKTVIVMIPNLICNQNNITSNLTIKYN